DATLVARFLDNACPDHHVRGGPDHVRARHTAMRLLARYPALATSSFSAAVVCGEIAMVEQMLGDDPSLATRSDGIPSEQRAGVGGDGDLVRADLGTKGWEPLLYLCFTRMPLAASNDNSLAIARLLLDAGADPNAYFMAGDSRYTPLVGAIGEGEENRPPHPHRNALVELLLERGAEPYDIQVVYNIGFSGNAQWFLERIHARAVALGREADWDDPEWSMLDMGGYGSGARWHLERAVKNDDAALAEWCLTHGAGLDAAPARDERSPQHSLYEEAVLRGSTEVVDALLRHGATASDIKPSLIQEFAQACLRLDRARVEVMIAEHPELLLAPEPLHEAARRDRADVVQFLLDLGVSPDVENAGKERALHAAAYDNAVAAAQVLIERGAAIDPVESSWGSTPMGAAAYSQHRAMIDLLSPHSRDVWELTHAGKVERLREVLAEQPERARVAWDGHTPLMWLATDDEARAIATAELFLEHGANPTLRNKDGMTAADRAERNGMLDLAERLRDAEASYASSPVEPYERMAWRLLEAYRTGDPEAMRRHWVDAGHQRTWPAMRRYILLYLGRQAPDDDAYVDISADDARFVVAQVHGFGGWQALVDSVTAQGASRRPLARNPVRLLGSNDATSSRDSETTRDWDAALETLASRQLPGLDAGGSMTNDLMERVAGMSHVTTLRLGGSAELTEEAALQLAKMPQLRHLDLSGTAITDRALHLIAGLPALETLNLAWTRVTDEGAAFLSRCDHLQRVDLSGTETGDGAISALGGKASLRHFASGNRVTNDGLRLLHRFPVFTRWQGGAESMALLSAGAEPNSLSLRGTFTDDGFSALVGLDGLFALNVDDSKLQLTGGAVAHLSKVPRLGWLAFDAKDESMPYIAALPALRFLMCQDTEAGDDGFEALSRSRSLEYIWGRRCYGLQRRGFVALANIPTLRGLSVSCKNVDDEGVSALPRFPALRELMPMDIPDDGYRHIGQCQRLESLILMYCRDTTDAATAHITGLTRLTKYFASYTRITDRSLDLLSGMASLEDVELSGCPGVTDAGVVALARLPRLKRLSLGGMQNVTSEVVSAFPPGAEVSYSIT
ncbi:MAG: ankyrin repeat domain-containing protein, partial [Gemmatimonadota bacterium]